MPPSGRTLSPLSPALFTLAQDPAFPPPPASLPPRSQSPQRDVKCAGYFGCTNLRLAAISLRLPRALRSSFGRYPTSRIVSMPVSPGCQVAAIRLRYSRDLSPRKAAQNLVTCRVRSIARLSGLLSNRSTCSNRLCNCHRVLEVCCQMPVSPVWAAVWRWLDAKLPHTLLRLENDLERPAAMLCVDAAVGVQFPFQPLHSASP